MKTSPVKKAYEIDFTRIDEGYLFCDRICYAENHNKAKSLLLKEVKNESVNLRSTGDEVTYTTIPVIRCKEADLYLFEEKELTKRQIEEIQTERERIAGLNAMLTDDAITHCYIRKGNYYRPGNSGYTDFRQYAGVYTKEEAVSSAKSCRDLRIIPIDISEHNEMIQSEVNSLLTRIIQ